MTDHRQVDFMSDKQVLDLFENLTNRPVTYEVNDWWVKQRIKALRAAIIKLNLEIWKKN